MTNQINVTTKPAVKINVNAVVRDGSGGVTSHHALQDLAAFDDHPQYQRTEATFVTDDPYTITTESIVITTGTAVTLPDAESVANRTVTIGAAISTVSISPAGADTMFDDPGNDYMLPAGSGVTFVAINIGGWGWAILARNGPVSDLPHWYEQGLTQGDVLQIGASGSPEWTTPTGGTGTVTSVTGSAPISVTASSTSPQVSIAAATTSAAGSMSSADFSKLAGIASGATANSPDATLLARANHTGTQALSTISDAGTAAAKNVPATGNASATEVVLGSDTRLSDTRTPGDGSVSTAKIADGAVTSAKIADGTIVDGDVSASAAISVTKISGLGTAAVANTGTGTTNVILGSDTRLSDARTPTAHAASHSTGGTDALTLAASQITSGVLSTDRLAGTGTASSSTYLRGDGSWSTVSATIADGAVTTAKIADAAVTSAKVSGGLARQAVVAAAKIADTTSTSAYVGSALVPYVGNTAGTLALALGTVYIAKAHHDGATLNRLVFVVSASSLSAGQSVTVAGFNDSGGTPGTRAWSQSVTVGTSTGGIITGSLSLAMPTGPCWIAILNPSGNAGTVTLRTGQVMASFLTVANDTLAGILAVESQSSMPSDLSSYTLRTATASSNLITSLGPQFPKLMGNAS